MSFPNDWGWSTWTSTSRTCGNPHHAGDRLQERVHNHVNRVGKEVHDKLGEVPEQERRQGRARAF